MLGSGCTGVPKPSRGLGRHYQLGQERRDAHGGNQSPADDDKLVAMINRQVWAFGSSQAALQHLAEYPIGIASTPRWASSLVWPSGAVVLLEQIDAKGIGVKA